MINASLQNYRISPRKVRVVANMIRGKEVGQAKLILSAGLKKATGPLMDLIDSAIANAKNNFKITDDQPLFVKEIRVDQGFVLKRIMPVSRGMAHGIKKRTSHVSIVLAPMESKVTKTEKPAPVIEAKAKKVTKTKAKNK